MRAAVLERFGPPEGIVVREVDDPAPGPGEALVDLVCASLNRREWWLRRSSPGRFALPAILGSDGAGVVAAVGPDVDEGLLGREVVIDPALDWGDRDDAPGPGFRILGVPDPGSYAERIAVPAANVRPRPERLSWEEAGALTLGALTAWRALVGRGGLERGATVLVTGAAGGVSTFAVQIACALGARPIVTSSSPAKLAAAALLGAEAGFLSGDPDWPAAVREASGGRGVDLAVDSIGPGAWDGCLDALRPGGTLVSYGDTGGDDVPVNLARLFFGQLSIHGSTLGSPRELTALLAHVREAAWRPAIDSVFPLEQVAAAHRRLDDPERFGKIVLRLRPDP